MKHRASRSRAAAATATLFAMVVAAPGTSSHADTVDELVAFTAGTKAKADEVNANFSEVANAVNGNDALIAELVAEIDELRKSLESAGSLFGRTLVVANSGDAAANCERLREALTGVDGVAANPVRIRLEPGTYDCGSTPIVMQSFVTIEGAGRNVSTILGNVAGLEQGLVNGSGDAELRNLSVENRSDDTGTAIAIRTSGEAMRLTNVAVAVDAAGSGIGVLANGGSLTLADVTVLVNAMQEGQGMRAVSGAQLDMTDTRVHAESGRFGNPAGLELHDSAATGFGILFSSAHFGLLGRGDSQFELADGTVIGHIGLGADFSGSFTCIGVADGDFNPRKPDCF